MKAITRKGEVIEALDICLQKYHSDGLEKCLVELNERLLKQKVKFPLLEFCGHTFYENFPEEDHIIFCDMIERLKTMGGNVVIAIILQRRLSTHFLQSFEKAVEYIALGEAWYICDIIGERLFGVSLLMEPEVALARIKELSHHESKWVVRSLGAGMHYAIKKGLDKDDVEKVFRLLLSMANVKEREIKQGIGWAAKTTAKFHPDIIKSYNEAIQNKENTGQWFRTKIKIGLNRNAYAKRN